VTLRMLDNDNDKEEITSLGIRGFPTILFFKDGQRFEYEGARTSDGIIQFLSGY
jgi:thioredoxin-like negative regulator of GroEL